LSVVPHTVDVDGSGPGNAPQVDVSFAHKATVYPHGMRKQQWTWASHTTQQVKNSVRARGEGHVVDVAPHSSEAT
jgi:hypothetical protein